MQTARKMATQIHRRERGNRIWSMPIGTAYRKQPYGPEEGSSKLLWNVISTHRLSLYVESVLLKTSMGTENEFNGKQAE
jgi:hypothetical protein